MKNIIYLFLLFATISSCSSKYESYNESDNKVSFIFEKNVSVKSQTFVYDPIAVVKDTIYLDIRAIGFVVDYDREISIEEFEVEGENSAKEGKESEIQ